MMRNNSFGELEKLPTPSVIRAKRNSIKTISERHDNSRLGSIKKSTGKETALGDYTIAPINIFDVKVHSKGTAAGNNLFSPKSVLTNTNLKLKRNTHFKTATENQNDK